MQRAFGPLTTNVIWERISASPIPIPEGRTKTASSGAYRIIHISTVLSAVDVRFTAKLNKTIRLTGSGHRDITYSTGRRRSRCPIFRSIFHLFSEQNWTEFLSWYSDSSLLCAWTFFRAFFVWKLFGKFRNWRETVAWNFDEVRLSDWNFRFGNIECLME